MKRARYHPAARDELRGAIAYDEADHPGRGVDLEEGVRRVIRRIQLLPQSAPRWPRMEAHEIRRAKVKRHPYLVVYAVLPDQLVVLAHDRAHEQETRLLARANREIGVEIASRHCSKCVVSRRRFASNCVQ